MVDGPVPMVGIAELRDREIRRWVRERSIVRRLPLVALLVVIALLGANSAVRTARSIEHVATAACGLQDACLSAQNPIIETKNGAFW